MGEDSPMVSPARGDNELDIPMCESPIDTAVSPVLETQKTGQQTSTPATPALPDLPPRVTTVVPASFVPIEADWSLPLNAANDPLSNKSTHAQVMLGTLDYYRTGVRKGIMHLASLDQKRILMAQAEAERAEKAAQTARQERARQLQCATESREGAGLCISVGAASNGLAKEKEREKEKEKEKETFTPPGPTDGDFVPPQEMDDMIAAMCAPAHPGANYSIPTEVMMSSHIQFPAPAVGEKPGGRRDHIRQYNEVTENSIMQLAGFNIHMRQQRERWEAVIGRERAAAPAEADRRETPPPPPPPPPSRHPPLHGPALRKEDANMSGV